ncbi:MAG: H/ACA ribonucleoprotein complex subunit GAR1 [Candidatus Hermodarchaeota archaeon]
MEELGVVPENFGTEMAIRLLNPHKIPPMHAPVILKNKQKIGIVSDIIGPIKSPWCVVQLRKRSFSFSEGQKLFFLREPQQKKKRTSQKRRRTSKGQDRSGSSKKRSHTKKKK